MKKTILIACLLICVWGNINFAYAQSLAPVIDNISNVQFTKGLNERLNLLDIDTVVRPLENDYNYVEKGFQSYKAETINKLHVGILRKGNSIYRVSMIFPKFNTMAKKDSGNLMAALTDMCGLDKEERETLFRLNKENAGRTWCKKTGSSLSRMGIVYMCI